MALDFSGLYGHILPGAVYAGIFYVLQKNFKCTNGKRGTNGIIYERNSDNSIARAREIIKGVRGSIYLIGIGGASMSGVAMMLLERGFLVLGKSVAVP